MKSTLLIILAAMLVLSACKKEATIAPNIKTVSPATGSFKWDTTYHLISESVPNHSTTFPDGNINPLGSSYIRFDSMATGRYATLNSAYSTMSHSLQTDTIEAISSTSVTFSIYHSAYEDYRHITFAVYAADSTYYLQSVADTILLRFKP